MYILKNIDYKSTNLNQKLLAVKAYKEITGANLSDSKAFVEKAIDSGTISIEDHKIAHLIANNVFKCDIIVETEENLVSDSIPDSDTQYALDWYEIQPFFIKERIDLILAWKQQQMIPIG
jgi:hypothetical protein